jgi:hypothetical protein
MRCVDESEGADMTEPAYIMTTVTRTVRKYNPKYGDDRVCKCGHKYYRHFDSYEDMEPVGCKYCQCLDFEEMVAAMAPTGEKP